MERAAEAVREDHGAFLPTVGLQPKQNIIISEWVPGQQAQDGQLQVHTAETEMEAGGQAGS